MTAQRTVVVTDVASPHRFLACLTAVHRTVPRDVAVVGVSAAFPKLPPQLERRVRKVRVPRGQELSDAVTAEAVRPVQVVVLTSDTRVGGDWLAELERLMAPTPYCVGLLGDGEPRVLFFGDRVRSSQAQDVHLPDVAGLSWPTSTGSPAGPATADTRVGGDERPVTVTAALIVKDEEAVLAACLEAVRGEVDEVVVYDTGSSDDTVEVARACGARVVEGYWDDDFGAARNRLLEHVDTEWVLSLDADEVLQGAPGALRARLVGERADLLQVPVVSTTWSAAQDGEEHRPVRVFRRATCCWTGALHETVVSPSGADLVLAHLPVPVRLMHSGYQADRMADKDKHARNLAIARAEVDGLGPDADDEVAARAWTNYGRALISAGQRGRGLDALEHLLGLRGNRSEMVQGARVAMLASLTLGRLTNFDRWMDTARRYGETDGARHVWQARLLLHHADLDGAAAELAAARESTGNDPWGVPFDPDEMAGTEAIVATRQGEPQRALDLLLDLLGRRQEMVPLAQLVQAAVDAGHPLADLGRRGGPQFVARSLRDAVQLPPAAADQWLEALYQDDPQPTVLVAGAVVAAKLPIAAVLKWSLWAREAGLVQLCPLRAIGYDVERDAVDRCVALAVLGDVLGEADALAEFDQVAAGIAPQDTGPLLTALATYAPGLAVEQTSEQTSEQAHHPAGRE